MRYEALLAAAFAAGLMGAMSQQGVAPHTRKAEDKPPGFGTVAQAGAHQVVIPVAAAPAAAAMASSAPSAGAATDGALNTAPMTAKDVAAEAKPVRKAVKLAKKAKPKPEVAAAAPPPEPPRHGFWYRLFHKTPDADRVAPADTGKS